MQPRLLFVVPCYNEEMVLPITAPIILSKLDSLVARNRIAADSGVLFVNDASTDSTWGVITELHARDARVTGVDLLYNVGEQRALLAGLFIAADRADCIITMDCDLQDDIEAVDLMVDRYLEGNDLVLGVRSSRSSAGFAEKFFSGAFYKLMKLLKTGQVTEHANYRLMSRRAVGVLKERISLPFYLPTVASTTGLPTAIVKHERLSRVAGKTGYTVKRRFRLAFDAIYAHSMLPLTGLTLLTVLFALLMLVSAAFLVVCSVRTHSFRMDLCILTAVCAAAVSILFALRVLGEYVVLIFRNAKREPIYQIKEIIE